MLAGCLSLQAGTGASVPVSGGPSRTASAQATLGGWYAWKDKCVFEAEAGSGLGPLGDHSNSVLLFGGRVTTASRGWRPGLYASLHGGGEDPNDPKAMVPNATVVLGSVGVAWTSIKRSNREWGADRFGSVMLGVVYHRQEQDDIGRGDFLGVQLSVVGGTNFVYELQDFAHGK